MATYKEVAKTHIEILGEISKNKDNWSNFLDFMAKFHKYSFNDVALIYAQKPDATACASMELWNKKMNCWVKQGTKGIALFDDLKGKLRYVFDVSDVTPARTIGRLPNPWVYDERDSSDVTEHLEETFFDFSEIENTFIEDIMLLGLKLSSSISEKVTNDIIGKTNNERESLKIKVEDFLATSFSHVVLTRLGIPKEEWINKLDYSYITTFNEPEIMEAIGEDLYALTRPVLEEIGRVVVKNNIERLKEEQYNNIEEKKENVTRRYEREEGRTNTERSGVHRGGRISNSELDNAGGSEGGRSESLRENAEGLPTREPLSAIQIPSDTWRTYRPPTRNTESSEGNGRISDRENGEARERDRGTQENRSISLGEGDELDQRQGEGNSDSGSNNEITQDQLSFFQTLSFPSIEEQAGEINQNAVSATISSDAAFSFDEEYLEIILRSGSGKRNSLPRIYEKYSQGLHKADIVDILKNEYFTDAPCYKGFYFDDNPYSVRSTENGLIISMGTSAREDNPNTIFYSYEVLEEKIRGLIERGEYVDKEIASHSHDIELSELSDKTASLFWDLEDRFYTDFNAYPDLEAFIKEKLTSQDGINEILSALDTASKDIDTTSLLKKDEYSFERVYKEIQNLKNERVVFPVSEKTIYVPLSSFVTQDAIDHVIIRDHIERQIVRTYKYFIDPEHTAKDKAEFVKHEWGIGGFSGPNRFKGDFDSKGFLIETPTNVEPFSRVFIKWPQIAKRIDELILKGEYISKEALSEFAEKENQKNIALSHIRGFLKSEYDNSDEDIEDSVKDTYKIPIAFSTTEWEDEFQAYINIERNRIEFEYRDSNGALGYCYKRFDSINELNDFLAYMSFGELVSLAEELISEEREIEETPFKESLKEEIKFTDFNVGYSEHPCFYGIPITRDRANNLSFALANKLFGILDEKQNKERDIYDDCGYYHKTDFSFTLSINGEEYNYSGRYDLGDGQKDLIGHIKAYHEWCLNPENSFLNVWKKEGEEEYQKKISEHRYVLDKIMPFLETQIKLTEDDNKALIEILDTESDWWSRKRLDYLPENEKDDFDCTITVSEEEYRLINEKGARFVRELASSHVDLRVLAIKEEQAEEILHAIGKAHFEEKEQENIAELIDSFDAPYNNYVITDDSISIATKSIRLENNINAIKLIKELDSEGRAPTEEEKDILAKYVGWGGLQEVFEYGHPRFKEVEDLLTFEEYDSARSSTLNAHYTNPMIIRSIYKALDRMGFREGNILEPALGTGNFFGSLPENMRNSNLYGVELDEISGKIAKYLYPDANITISGFERTDEVIPDNFFDVVVGNVPFGEYRVYDSKYNPNNFMIHDYFISKSLEKVKPGGVVAVITSKGTLDKMSTRERKHFASKAELLGAIRLPNNAFSNAGTEVTSDILFLKKRERTLSVTPSWVDLDKNEDNLQMNSYFIEHPEMVLGQMEEVSGRYGMVTTCAPRENDNLEELLDAAIQNISANIFTPEVTFDELEEISGDLVPAVPDIKNYSYGISDDTVYFRRGSTMEPAKDKGNNLNRIKGLIILRDAVRELINLQLLGIDDETFEEKRTSLNALYDDFNKKYGRINDKANKKAFEEDESYYLLASLEDYDSDGNFLKKADIFDKRTIRPQVEITHVETAHEALALSISNRARVDLSYMSYLTDIPEEELANELKGVIFSDPETHSYYTADEYLSGNVREKLKVAERFAESDQNYQVNVEALKAVQPKDLEAQDIDIRLGATWIPQSIIKDFLIDTFNPASYALYHIDVQYSEYTAKWNIEGKNWERSNPIVNATYGTDRMNGYFVLEHALNLQDCRVYDKITDENGKEKRVVNAQETMLATQKKEQLCDAFRDWVYSDLERRELLCKIYNEKFNSVRPREYNGEYLTFVGMSNEIELKPHQKSAIARQIYGGNTLLAHCVGAGKTYEMVAAAMEMKRLGLCTKSLFVVPNNIVGQTASEFMKLYPNANILVTDNLSASNRKKFCSRIATGDYDAIIIPQSQFQLLPLSSERQINYIQDEIDKTIKFIAEEKYNKSENFTIKQMEKTKKTLEARLNKLMDQKRDDVVTFEELGIDRLFIDESHNFKNLSTVTKLGNVPGISTSQAKRSEDLLLKCKYLNEVTNNKGVIFATGTPISNSMTELFTNMRYLQPERLENLGLANFDAWASTFGEIVTAIELDTVGKGYRSKRRFAKFHNIPELMMLFKEIADVQTSDMLNLPVPEAIYETVVLKPSEAQEHLVQSFSKRADMVRNKQVDATVDNMLKITTDGRKAALDQRIINPELPESENSKAKALSEKAFEIYKETMDIKGTQLIFSDLSTPTGDSEFNIYDDVKKKLIALGVPENEIAFIHDYEGKVQKERLFAKVNNGDVRFLFGSTQKLGTGSNVQQRLVALHHLDVPWRPSDIEQREGRIIRQGNMNERVKIFRYVTENTFDSYSWQTIENKQKFIGQVMTSKSPVRSCSDIDETALSYAEIKALAAGNPEIKEKMELDIEVSKLKLARANHEGQKYNLQRQIAQILPDNIVKTEEYLKGYKLDLDTLSKYPEESSFITINGVTFKESKDAGNAINEMKKDQRVFSKGVEIGDYRGFKMVLSFDSFAKVYSISLKGALSHNVELGSDPVGNITRINNKLESLSKSYENQLLKLEGLKKDLEQAKIEVGKPFPQEDEYQEKNARLRELNAKLEVDKTDGETLDGGIENNDDNVPQVEEVTKNYQSVPEISKTNDFSKE